MAIPRKGSRLLTLDGVVYRWRVRHKPTYSQGSGASPMSFAVERAEEPGTVLVVNLPSARPDNWMQIRAIAVRPALVRACMRRALAGGWTAAGSGAPFKLDITEDQLPDLLGESPDYFTAYPWGKAAGSIWRSR